MCSPVQPAADWTQLDRGVWSGTLALLSAFRQKVLCQQVCKAWLFDLRDEPVRGVWGNKLTLKYDSNTEVLPSSKSAVALGSGVSPVISLSRARDHLHVVRWILKRASGWHQILFWDAESWESPGVSQTTPSLALSLQSLLLGLERLGAPDLSIRVQGQCTAQLAIWQCTCLRPCSVKTHGCRLGRSTNAEAFVLPPAE